MYLRRSVTTVVLYDQRWKIWPMTKNFIWNISKSAIEDTHSVPIDWWEADKVAASSS